MSKITVIITSAHEPNTIGKAVDSILQPNKDLWPHLQLLVVAPDAKTLIAAKKAIPAGYKSADFLKDKLQGKPAALNMAMEKAKGEIIFMTDGDMFINDGSIKKMMRHFNDESVGAVSGRPVSLDDRTKQFGYYSHLFCEAAHIKRLESDFVPASGYLYAFRNTKGLFPLDENIRAEDAYISLKIAESDKKVAYEPEALAYVRFPKNIRDWVKQKTRSLGGNVQVESRSISQDLSMLMFPFQFASNIREYWYSLWLYPIRLYLWIAIHIKHSSGKLGTGAWERIESSKS